MVLRKKPDPLPSRWTLGRLPEEPGRAVGWMHEAEEDFYQCRFSGPVWPQEAKDGAFGDVEGHPIEGLDRRPSKESRVIRLLQVGDGDGGGGHGQVGSIRTFGRRGSVVARVGEGDRSAGRAGVLVNCVDRPLWEGDLHVMLVEGAL